MALSREDLIRGLRQVVEHLRAAGEPGGIRIIGGAALSLRHFERGTTDDLDATVHPTEPAMLAAAGVAARNGWTTSWFNTAAAQFVPFAIAEREPLYDDSEVSVWVASARMMLAMKLRASRPGRDEDDIANLLAICEVANSDDAGELYEEFYPGEILEPKAHRILNVVFAKGLPKIPESPPAVSI